MECRPSDYNGRSSKDGSGGVGHIPRPASEMLISDPNRERNGKEKEDSTTQDLSSVFHVLNLGATP
jgi:hypothetical protein